MKIDFVRDEIVETPKAVGVKSHHFGRTKMMWFPKSLIENDWEVKDYIIVKESIYNRQFERLFS